MGGYSHSPQGCGEDVGDEISREQKRTHFARCQCWRGLGAMEQSLNVRNCRILKVEKTLKAFYGFCAVQKQPPE